jgi:hypothetical protein
MKRWGLFVLTAVTLLLSSAALLQAGRNRGHAPPHAAISHAAEVQYRQAPVRHWRACLLQP